MKNVKPKKKDVMEFLRESNAIEGVYDEDSLKQAKLAWDFLIGCPKLSISCILDAHAILMKNHDIPFNEKGLFRQRPVWIGGREGVEWSHIGEFMFAWLLDVEATLEYPGPEGKHIILDHVSFENVHPFIDGNGRMGRMLLNYERVKVGLPILVIKEKERNEYYKLFKN